ncbi:hypothetical protein niasHS_015288 [Heterodera schachtii]|uniref:Uncharacterized protein n=1 Tax=Heterodera schachtii TaxID=97005 RepID=A0ABD2I5Q0_HETSC
MHFSMIQKLIDKFPGLTKPFADNAWTVPRYRNYAIFNAEEQIELYKLIFDSDQKTSHKTETKLAMKQLIGMAKEREENLLKNPKIADEIRNTKTQTFTVMALSETFCPSKEWPVDRMLCPLGQYVQFLSEMAKNRPKIEWEAPIWCFSHDTNEIFEWVRQILLEERIEFFKNYLKKETNGKDDEIIRIIREKPGAMMRLHNLVQHKLIEELWKDEQIREKLYNANFFSNKSRLLHNYRRAMAKSSSPIERLGARLAADIAAMANHLSAKFPKVQPHLRAALSSCQSFPPPFSPNSNFSSFSELLDFVWVDLRYLYDKSDPTIYDERIYKLISIFVNNYLSELYKFIEKQLKKPSKKAQKIWINRTHFFVATISNLRWLEEADEKAVEPLELVQQIHFETVKKHLNDEEIGREMREIFLDCPQFLQIGAIFLPISNENRNKKCGKKHTEINREETFKIVGELVHREFSINFGKVWLFGIEMPANGNEKLKENLRNFDIEMKMEYLQQLGLLSAEMDEMELINEFQKLGANVLATVAKKWVLMDILEDKIIINE